MLVEVCANSLQSALNAQRAGVDRIELCSELAVGGITPSYGLLKSVREKISIPVHVLVRPRSGDFTYTSDELEIMKEDIALCVELGFDGIVSGVLKTDFSLDVDRTKQLIGASGSLKFTFHRAFDWVRDPLEAFGQLQSLGVDYVLTSGQRPSAVEGMVLLKALLKDESNCILMPGGGVKPTNVETFMAEGFKAVHLSGTKFFRTLPESDRVSMNSASFLSDTEIALTDLNTIEDVVNRVK
ncbi:copper homeostasis protein CutC [Zobellia uliginosa]|uniref:copper homeostasis protein CutC n=1 Tax=Zobellia uliginosa TaxID=143224 RepID=UPI0026E11906|nr:copper homeostasis protein CutC [Zobellia uliginosa]MDO6517447.1 copper homeostasis protein CutC [Zobellia uliginosa]